MPYDEDMIKAAQAAGARTYHDRHLYYRLMQLRLYDDAADQRATSERLRQSRTVAVVLERGQFFAAPSGRDRPVSIGPVSESYPLALSLARIHSNYTYCEGFILRPSDGTTVEQAWCVRVDGRTVDTSNDGAALSRFGVVFRRGFALRHQVPLLDELIRTRRSQSWLQQVIVPVGPPFNGTRT
jgi:hypothetical protein